VGDGDAAVPAMRELVIERLHGDLRYVPDDLGAVLAPWLPGELSGREEQPIAFDFAGRTRDLALDSLLAGVEGTATIGVGRLRTPTVETWGTARCCGDLSGSDKSAEPLNREQAVAWFCHI
jgi:hypothetical protein